MGDPDRVAQHRPLNLIQYVMRDVMKSGEHYGTIPGCGDKAVLLKPGAEKLMLTFRLANDVDVETIDLHLGHREYRIKVTLYSPAGQRLGTGVGSCSTMESKYRFRVGPVELTNKPVPREYWDLRKENPAKAQEIIGGRGFSAKKDDSGNWKIARQGEKVEHDNPADFHNTCLKMAKKRGLVDAVLTSTAASDIFTIDPEVQIGGSILVVDLNAGTYREFNSYAPNKLVFNQLMEKGQHILAATRGECTPRTEPGILCGYCPFRTGCPSHAVGLDLPREIVEAGRMYLALNEQKKALKSRLDILKNDILTFADGTFKGASDGILINVTTVAESVMTDSSKFKRNYPDIYDQVTKPKAGFVKLEIKPFTPLKVQAA